MRRRARKGLIATAARNGARASAMGQPNHARVPTTAAGTSTATRDGATVCAKKYSTSSTSCVAIPTRSPLRRRTRYAGASRSSLLNRAMRISASMRNAMSWANHDSSQCSTPARGATNARATRYGAYGSPRFTAATARAPATPTPIRAATLAIPNTSTTENFTFHGTTWRSSSRNTPVHPSPSARRIASVGSSCAPEPSACTSSGGGSLGLALPSATAAADPSATALSCAWAPISRK